MKMPYLKLSAKKRMMNDTLRCFFVSLLPISVFSFLVIFNYYLPFFLKKTLVGEDLYLIIFFTVSSVVISYLLWKCACLVKEKFFFMKISQKKVTLLKSLRSISFKQYVMFWKVSVLRALLSVSWSAVYFSPCLVVFALLIYSYRYENYGMNVNLTLFISSVLLFLVGATHFFVTLKRYSMCEAIILKDKQKNPLKIIADSISVMENHSIEYSFYCVSFIGWVLSCVFIIPLLYVLPFVNMSKWCYAEYLLKPKTQTENSEKPIIFYIQKRKEV